MFDYKIGRLHFEVSQNDTANDFDDGSHV